jgi:DNA-binding CsgD family transcriptional regulator
VSIALSSADVAQLEAALTTLLSPLGYERLGDWRTASRKAIERLLEADSSGGVLPLVNEPLTECDAHMAPGALAYETYYHRLDTGLQVTRRERGLEVFGIHDIYDWAAYKKTEIFHDWNRRHRLYDGLAMATDIAEGLPAASLHFYHESEWGIPFGERGLTLLGLLLPAFKAGVRTALQLHGYRAALADALDRSGQGALLCDAAGRVLHATPALEHTLSADPEQARVRRAMGRAAALLAARLRARRAQDSGPPGAPSAEVATGRARYRVHASYAGRSVLGPAAPILVLLERVTPEPWSDAALEARFRLTPREVAVARLLAERRGAREIARELTISVHTARRHTEHVYVKLGVGSRDAVADVLRAPAVQAIHRDLRE